MKYSAFYLCIIFIVHVSFDYNNEFQTYTIKLLFILSMYFITILIGIIRWLLQILWEVWPSTFGVFSFNIFCFFCCLSKPFAFIHLQFCFVGLLFVRSFLTACEIIVLFNFQNCYSFDLSILTFNYFILKHRNINIPMLIGLIYLIID